MELDLCERDTSWWMCSSNWLFLAKVILKTRPSSCRRILPQVSWRSGSTSIYVVGEKIWGPKHQVVGNLSSVKQDSLLTSFSTVHKANTKQKQQQQLFKESGKSCSLVWWTKIFGLTPYKTVIWEWPPIEQKYEVEFLRDVDGLGVMTPCMLHVTC
jgi:hypothetical protein